jgi:hypothetical protein
MSNHRPSPSQSENVAWQFTPPNSPSSTNSPPPVAQQPFPPVGSAPDAYPPPTGYAPFSYPYPFPYPFPEQDKRRDFALAGMIVGIFSIVLSTSALFGLATSITGIVLSVMGRRSTTRRTMANVGLGLSIAGLVLATLMIALFALYIYWIFHLIQTLPHTSSSY